MRVGVARSLSVCLTAILLSFCLIAPSPAGDDYQINWYTIDGGGHSRVAAGAYEIAGTIGQPDAGTMSSGNYVMRSGFWPGAVARCRCPADLSADGRVNGADIRQFVECFLGSGSSCICADMDRTGNLTTSDLSLFVAALLTGGGCP